MATFLSLQCRNCQARYAVPDAYKPHIEGRMMLCPECRRSWIPLPGSRDGDSIEPSKVDLRKFRLKPGQEVPTAAPTPAPSQPPAQPQTGSAQPQTGPAQPQTVPAQPQTVPAQPQTVPAQPSGTWTPAEGAGLTTKIPIASTAPSDLTLRMIVQGPGANLTGVFDLRDKRFVIGRAACHLRLPKAAIPDHAIEIRSAPGGFIVEGINGFPLILGALSAPSAMVTPGSTVRLAIIPYQLELQTSNTPGSPVKDLAEIPHVAQPAPQPIGPRPVGPIGAGPAAAPPSPLPPGAPSSGPAIQALAADVAEQPGAFGGGATSLLDEVDGDMTIADMGAIGLNAQSHHVDPLKGLEVTLERADGPEQGQKFAVSKTPLIVGRSEHGMQIRDKRVSSKHAQLDISGPWVYTLKDLASTNGTMVNGRPISVVQLGDGDLISFGGVTFTFRAQKQ